MSLSLSEIKEAIKQVGRDEFETLLQDYDEEVIKAALACDVQLEDLQEAYQGEYDSDVDFAQQMAEETGSYNKNATWPYDCIDWKRAARDLMMDYCEDNHHYFRSL